jgi:hypothetical protein
MSYESMCRLLLGGSFAPTKWSKPSLVQPQATWRHSGGSWRGCHFNRFAVLLRIECDGFLSVGERNKSQLHHYAGSLGNELERTNGTTLDDLTWSITPTRSCCVRDPHLESPGPGAR